ncbi:MAG: hypothetical protein HY901_13575 [Deltaproteobacteria bacterium]|nr:hypothetical protein [Deltaproteobacteria bacterium]
MRLRYRKLTSRTDPDAVREVRENLQADSLRGSGDNLILNEVMARAEAPRAVTAEDGEAEVWEVEGLLHRGDLRTTDLVDTGKGWEPLGESHLFLDVCERLEKRRRLRSVLYWSGLLTLAVALVVGMLIRASSH